MPIIACSNQHIDIKIPHGSSDRVIVPDNVEITFNLGIESKDKTRSIVNTVDRALVKKKVLMLGSKHISLINKSDIYDTCKNLYLSEKEREEKLLQAMQSAKVSPKCGNKKSRWQSTDIDNRGKCDYKDV